MEKEGVGFAKRALVDLLCEKLLNHVAENAFNAKLQNVSNDNRYESHIRGKYLEAN